MNTLGQIFKVSSFGESHGPAVGALIEGCPAGLSLNLEAIQEAVNKRRSGTRVFASARLEADRVEILSGVFESRTLGSPIAIVIENTDAKPQDYEALKNVYRPGHADLSYQLKYGYRDHRGGGRSSIRITAPLVAAGDIARQLLQSQFDYRSSTYVCSIGSIAMPGHAYFFTEEQIEQAETRCPDPDTNRQMLELIRQVQEEKDSLGGCIQVVLTNVPAGLGEPVFDKLPARLSQAMMSINTALCFEFGNGIEASLRKGSAHNEQYMANAGMVRSRNNMQAGSSGGISTGEDIHFKIYFKPLSGIQQKQRTLNKDLDEVDLHIGGRHDVCAIPRAVPIVSAYTHLVLADLLLQKKINTL